MPVYTPEKPEFGVTCPDFYLPATNRKSYALKDFRNDKPFVVMFICNHCPYVKAIEDRLIQLTIDLKVHDINVIAICSNDAVTYPEDSFIFLKKRAQEKNYPFIYLHDESQSVAKSFGAICTPDYFVYDGEAKLKYRGRLDDSWKDSNLVTAREMHDAVLELAASKAITKPQIPSMGCSIKWIK